MSAYGAAGKGAWRPFFVSEFCPVIVMEPFAGNESLVSLIEPVVTGLGYELWGVQFLPQQGHGVLQLYIDREGGVNLDDCARVSYQLSGVLDVEDPITVPYQLEVSSPGLDRPLFTEAQYRRYAGHKIKVRLHTPVEGRRNFTGELLRVDDGAVILRQGDEQYRLPLDDIDSARVIPEF